MLLGDFRVLAKGLGGRGDAIGGEQAAIAETLAQPDHASLVVDHLALVVDHREKNRIATHIDRSSGHRTSQGGQPNATVRAPKRVGSSLRRW